MALMKDVKMPKQFNQAVTIGTCSAIRGIGLARAMGFRKVTLVGYDSNLETKPANPEEKLDTGAPKFYSVGLNPVSGAQVYVVRDENLPLVPDEKRFWTTGELVALYQDFINIIPSLEMEGINMKIEVLNDDSTLIGYGWKMLQMAKKSAKDAETQMLNSCPDYKDLYDKGYVKLELTSK